jgi:nicotinamide-nucleotide amidase
MVCLSYSSYIMELFNKKELEKIGSYLLRKQETIAVAESVTAGLLQYAFSNTPDAAKFFQGGLTAYNIAQKFKHLQVEPLHAQSVNCVSEKVAREMALQVCKVFQSHWGIGITGYATPTPESDDKVFAWYAICYQGKVKNAGRMRSSKDDPPAVQLQYVTTVLHKLASSLDR